MLHLRARGFAPFTFPGCNSLNMSAITLRRDIGVRGRRADRRAKPREHRVVAGMGCHSRKEVAERTGHKFRGQPISRNLVGGKQHPTTFLHASLAVATMRGDPNDLSP